MLINQDIRVVETQTAFLLYLPALPPAYYPLKPTHDSFNRLSDAVMAETGARIVYDMRSAILVTIPVPDVNARTVGTLKRLARQHLEYE